MTIISSDSLAIKIIISVTNCKEIEKLQPNNYAERKQTTMDTNADLNYFVAKL